MALKDEMSALFRPEEAGDDEMMSLLDMTSNSDLRYLVPITGVIVEDFCP